MQIATNGVILNEFGRILLIRRNDTRTMALPGGGLEGGELPTESVAREVREETGLIVLPVRLVGLYFWPTKPEGVLSLVFRCIQRGGEIKTSRESPQVGFFGTDPLPSPMLAMHRHRIQQAVRHAGGPPQWEVQDVTRRMRFAKLLLENVIYRAMDLRRSLLRLPAFKPSPVWRTSASAVTRDTNGRLLWVREQGKSQWQLPGASSLTLEPPWRTAVRAIGELFAQNVVLTGLSGVYLHEKEQQVRFVFAAELNGGEMSANVYGTDLAFLEPGEVPSRSAPLAHSYVQDASGSSQLTVFRWENGARVRS